MAEGRTVALGSVPGWLRFVLALWAIALLLLALQALELWLFGAFTG